jgi:hypothetical protein
MGARAGPLHARADVVMMNAAEHSRGRLRGPWLWPLVSIVVVWGLVVAGVTFSVVVHGHSRPRAPVGELPSSGPVIAVGELVATSSKNAPNGAPVAAWAAWIERPALSGTNIGMCASDADDVVVTDGRVALHVTPELLRVNTNVGPRREGVSTATWPDAQRIMPPPCSAPPLVSMTSQIQPQRYVLVTFAARQHVEISGCREGETLRACPDDWNGAASEPAASSTLFAKELLRHDPSELRRRLRFVGLLLGFVLGVWGLQRLLRGGVAPDLRVYASRGEEDR